METHKNIVKEEKEKEEIAKKNNLMLKKSTKIESR